MVPVCFAKWPIKGWSSVSWENFFQLSTKVGGTTNWEKYVCVIVRNISLAPNRSCFISPSKSNYISMVRVAGAVYGSRKISLALTAAAILPSKPSQGCSFDCFCKWLFLQLRPPGHKIKLPKHIWCFSAWCPSWVKAVSVTEYWVTLSVVLRLLSVRFWTIHDPPNHPPVSLHLCTPTQESSSTH